MHGITEQEWMDYLDQRLAGSAYARIDAHLASCHKCREFQERMLRTEKSLAVAGVELKRGQPLDDEQLNLGLAKILARILDAEAKQQGLSRHAIQERLNNLEELLALMCGSWTAVNALRLAAEGTLVSSLDKLTQDNWPSFLNRLSSIAAVFCGEAGAKLVSEYGRL